MFEFEQHFRQHAKITVQKEKRYDANLNSLKLFLTKRIVGKQKWCSLKKIQNFFFFFEKKNVWTFISKQNQAVSDTLPSCGVVR